MIAYWNRGLEWMGEGLQLAICPSFTGPTSLAALDVSGNANHGRIFGVDGNSFWPVIGDRTSLGFFGNPRYVDVPDAPNLNPTQQIGFSVWYNSLSASSSFGYCLLAKTTSVNAQPYPAFDIRGATGNTFELTIAIGGGNSRIISLGAMVANQWTHIAFTYNGNLLSGYRNGVLVSTLSVTGAIGTTTNPLRIGDNAGFTNRWFSGYVDDLRMHNRVLTASEIRQMYDLGRGGGMLYQPPKRRSVFIAAGFRAYWHRRQSQVIGGGV